MHGSGPVDRNGNQPAQNVSSNYIQQFIKVSNYLKDKRKNIQLIVDLSVFCLSSLFSIAAFYFIEKDIIIQTHILIIIEVLIIFFLGSQIVSNNPIYKK